MRVVVVAPPEPVISWSDADAHLKLDGDESDRAYVEGLIAAATAHIDGPDGWLGRSIGRQTLEVRFDLTYHGRSPFRLPYGPVIDLVSVKYLDFNGTEQTANTADFLLLGDEVAPANSVYPWDGGSTQREAGRIQYHAGHEEVPAPIKAAILLMVGDLYRNRDTVAAGTVSKIPMSTAPAALLRPYRVFA